MGELLALVTVGEGILLLVGVLLLCYVVTRFVSTAYFRSREDHLCRVSTLAQQSYTEENADTDNARDSTKE